MFKLILKYFSPIFLKIYDEYNKNFERNFKNLDRDAQNEFDLLDDMYPNDDSKSYGRRRGLDAKGEHKARSIRKNLGIK